MIEKKIRCDDGDEFQFLFYVRDHVLRVRLSPFSRERSLTLESFWRQMTQIMDEAVGLGVPNAVSTYTCSDCEFEFKYSSKSGEAPNFCPNCATSCTD
jgi:hypothetical protein